MASTLSGRLDPESGRAQVAGFPLPSEASRIRSLVALADVGGAQRSETSVTVGELLLERLEMTQPWYRMWRTSGAARHWLDRINAVLEQAAGRPTMTVTARSTLVELPQLERAVALSALALAERTPIVMLDQLDPFGTDADATAYLAALDLLASPTTTIFLGTPLAPELVTVVGTGRPIAFIDLYAASAAGTKGGIA